MAGQISTNNSGKGPYRKKNKSLPFQYSNAK